MSRDELRPCSIETVEINLETEEVEKAEVHKAFFHRWYEDEIGNYKQLIAVVEYEDGTIHFVKPQQITFINKKIDAYWDANLMLHRKK